MDTVEGVINNVIYNSGQYFILEVAPAGQEGRSLISVKGTFFGVSTLKRNMPLRFHGSWSKSNKFGRQFAAKDWEPFAYNVVGMKTFLSEALVDFDYLVANLLVDTYGRDTYRMLTEQQGRVLEDLKTANENDLKMAFASWERTLAIRALSAILKEGGISLTDIGAAVHRFGMEAPAIIKENPFRLMEIPGFSFARVDKLAATLGLDAASPCRLEGAILWALNEGTKNGHLYMRRSNLLSLMPVVPVVEGPLPLDDTAEDKGITPALRALIQRKSIRVEAGIGAYLPEMHEYERGSAAKIARMLTPTTWDMELDPFLEEFQNSSSLNLSDAQKDAVRYVVKDKVLVLTGLPGTGKTTAVRAVVRLFEKARVSFTLMAPTGIAAKRLANVTGYPASTIHRALGYDGMSWRQNDENRYITDAVIVDEVSMVDMELLYRLLMALRDDTMLVLVGDDAQLPSVGPGNVLKELVACDKVPSVRLTQIFRQTEGGDIVSNSHKINSGEFPELGDPKSDSEFCYIRLNDEYKIREYIVKMAAKLKARNANFQVLAPKYDGVVGVDSLNSALRDVLNPPGPPEWKGDKQHFRVGDRVMVVKNNYQKGVYNGDVGKLLYVGNDRLIVRVYGVGDNSDLEVSFTEGEADMYLRLAYAITVHKCLHPDTLVETDQGLLRAGDLPSEGLVQTAAGFKAYRGLVSNPDSPLIKLRTKENYELQVTLTHGVDVWDPHQSKYRRVEAHRVKVGDFVRLGLGLDTCEGLGTIELPPDPGSDVRAQPYRIPFEVTPDLAEFLGLMVGDGTVYPKGFRLLKRHLDVVDRFAALGESLFGLTPTRGFKEGGFFAEFNSVPVASWLASVGGLLPWAKAVPSVVLRSGKEIRRRFLRGLFEDGSVHLNRAGFLDHIEFSNYDPNLLEVVRVLLLGFGLPSSLYAPSGRQPRLFIYGRYCSLYGDTIGFISEFKQQRLEVPSGDQTRCMVPISRSELDSIADFLGGRRSLTHSELNAYPRGCMSRHQLEKTLGRIPSEFEEEAVVSTLVDRLRQHHSRVASVSLSHGPSVCVEVPDGHQFIQGGFFGWNSQGSEFDTIIMPVVLSQGRMLQRNLLYTAVTRAKQKVWLLGEEGAIRQAIANNKVLSRNTALATALSGVIDGDARSAQPTTGTPKAGNSV